MKKSIAIGDIIRLPNAPVFGVYRIREAEFGEDESEIIFRLADATGSILASANAFELMYSHPGEMDDAVLHCQGKIEINTSGEAIVQVADLTESEHAVYGHIQQVPREVCVKSALPYFDQIIERIEAMNSDVIRRFCELALGHPRIYETYFRNGASWSSHHAEPGGLAKHVSEMILMIDGCPLLSDMPDWRRDLCVAGAVVHDLTKITGRSSGSDDYSNLIRSLSVPIRHFEEHWPDGAKHILEMLKGFPRATHPQTVEGAVLWAADRLSATAAAERHAFDHIANETAKVVEAKTGKTSMRIYQRPSAPPDVHS